MAASRVNNPGAFDRLPKRKPTKSPDYLSFIHQLPCIITRREDVVIQAAHLSFAERQYGHYGRAKQSKASDRWVLPLSSEKHTEQHAGNEREFWARHSINPHLACLVIWGLWTEAKEDARDEIAELIMRGDFRG